MAARFATYYINSDFHRIAYFSYPSGQFDYENEIREILQSRLIPCGKKLLIEYLPNDFQTEPDNTELHLHGLRQMLNRGERPDLLYIIRNVDLQRMADLLEEYGLHIGENIQILCIRHLCNTDRFPRVLALEIDYGEFARSVFDQLVDLIAEPDRLICCDLSHQVRQRIAGNGIHQIL